MTNRPEAGDRVRHVAVRHQRAQHQAGQALAEGLAVVALLLVFFVAIGWLGRLHDIAMAAQHASSLAAFTLARSASPASAVGPGGYVDAMLSGAEGQRWLDLQGRSLVHDASVSPFVRVGSDPVPANAQPGGASAQAQALRRDWGIHDRSMLTAAVSMPWRGPGGVVAPVPAGVAGDEAMPVQARTTAGAYRAGQAFLHRHTVLIAEAGHASHDAEVGRRMGQSWLAWRRSARVSVRLAEKVGRIMEPVDAVWPRASVSTDWLGPWAGRVPRAYLAPAAPYASTH